MYRNKYDARIVGVQSTEQSAGIKARAFDPDIISVKVYTKL